MPSLIILEGFKLVPVVELEPCVFSTQSRTLPSGSGLEVPEEWYCYWRESLADSGVTGLRPLRPGSWHVPTTEFVKTGMLEKVLGIIFQRWGGIETLSDPDCQPVLNGGLALCDAAGEAVITPGCCADLGDAKNWKEASEFRGKEWEMLWIGHPWLSVRYESPWLVVSEPHESTSPSDQWAVSPDELHDVVEGAEAELESFARRIAQVLLALSYNGDSNSMARQLAGIEQRG